MNFLKPIVIFSFFLVPFIQKDFAQEIKKLCKSEYINGRVKAVFEIIHFTNGDIKIQKKIIRQFDNNHHFTNCLIAGDPKTDQSSKYFDDKYIKPRKDQDTLGLNYVDAFNSSGNICSTNCYLKTGKQYFKNVFKFGKYNIGRNITEFDIYDWKDSLVYKQVYIFNMNDFLIEVDNYVSNTQITSRIIYKYITFDKKSNWTKRLETRKSLAGKIIGVVVTERKITYY